MIDHAETIRQKFIADFVLSEKSLDTKRAVLRARFHLEGKYFIGEETLAKQNRGRVFDHLTGWGNK